MKTELWLDLEGTVIPRWERLETHINIDKVQWIVDEFNVESIGIYSYIIYSEQHLTTLRKDDIISVFRNMVPTGTVEILTTMDMGMHWKGSHASERGFQPRPTDIWDIPKELSFLMTVNQRIKDGSDTKKFILFDDTVPHGKTYKINDDVEVLFLNPDA